jgi:hypothetical protein
MVAALSGGVNHSEAAPRDNAALPVVGQATAGVEEEGTLTVILRSIEVADRVMTVKFALQWDNPKKTSSHKTSLQALSELGKGALMVIDPKTLTGYRPVCSEGRYLKSDSPSTTADDIHCNSSQVRWPGDYFSLPNHGLVEGGAVLPAPEGKPATLDISFGAPLPPFTGVPVTYR